MGVTQDHIDLATPMGANLVTGAPAGATFRVWAPKAHAVFLNGSFGGAAAWSKDQDQGLALRRIAGGNWWGGFLAGAGEGDLYKFYVAGDRDPPGYKRDPYARERHDDGNCVIRSASAYPWHDQGFVPPAFNDMVIYQLHVGSFYRHSGAGDGTFLDVVEKIPYIAALGVNVVQLLPVNEFETPSSEGYNGSDYFAPEFRYGVDDPTTPVDYLAIANAMLAAHGQPPLAAAQVAGPHAQLKLLVDLCHLHGLAVHFDVVYNHAGDFTGDDESIYFWDRQSGDNNSSLYFIDGGHMDPGGLPFALWKQEVQAFLIDHARTLATELHADGLRYDEVSLLCAKNSEHGWPFCQAVTGTLRYLKPAAFHNAECWPVNTNTVMPAASGGAGFDGTQNDGLRIAIRAAIGQAVAGADAFVDCGGIAGNLTVPWFPARWKAVQCVENHDVVFAGKEPRISRLADPSNPWSWYGRSRARLALGLLMTAPGIPQLFMGQEFLEDKQWKDDPNGPLHIYWDGLSLGRKPMVDFLRFTQEIVLLRRATPALRGEPINVFHAPDANRVLAFHRWLEGLGEDVVVVATLSETTLYGHRIGFPRGGRWSEIFNSDVYDSWVNPSVAGNGGGVFAADEPWDNLGFSAAITVPANGILVFKWAP